VLWEWGLDYAAETAELLVSELITNAVKAAREMGGDVPVWMRVSADRDRICIEVWDSNPRQPAAVAPEAGPPDPYEEGGRGLFLVQRLSLRWNWHSTREPAGKIVWCELDARRPDQEDLMELPPSLPQRKPEWLSVRPAAAIGKPADLRRVRDRIRDLDAGQGGSPPVRNV
jgi:anti-sigma regulatory factor (Ser/Thr protein kinase)